MTNSDLFKQAHALTNATIKAGDNYQATFGQCLKTIKAAQVKPLSLSVKVARKMAPIDWDYVLTLSFTVIAMLTLTLFCSAILVAVQSVLVGSVFFGAVFSAIVTLVVWAVKEDSK